MSLSNKGGWTPPAPGDISPPDLPETHDDMHTQANVEDFSPQHIEIDWLVDWDKKILQGQVIHTLSLAKENVGTITLDTSYLEIRKVSLIKENDSDEELSFKLEKRRGTLGSALSIQIGKHRKGDKIKVRIYYETTPKCTALGWLNAEQTESKSMPFLYSQAQAIHARSMLPCVDSPSHKITYTSQVRSKYPVLMSALADGSVRATDKEIGDALVRDSNNDIATYRFRQPVGVPTYLIAIVGGNLVFRSLGPRVGVWAEPTMIDRVEWEFKEDADRFLKAAEETISPYSWTRYDSVVLPPSFPYGGMENANLTTLTPTLICGDRNQTDVLLHELSHSWSGNLTSCANWSSFWLNEGINVWIERLLLSVVHGPAGGDAIRGLHYTIGQKAFHDAVDQFKDTPRFQRLVPLMKEGEDPDDAFSSIPYEKGSTFLLYLERLVGGLDVFLPFIRSYFKAFYNRSVSTEEWKQHLFDFYKGNDTIIRNLEGVNWDAWFHGEGKALPSPVPFDESLAEQVYSLVQRWTDVIQGHKVDGSFSPADIAGWDPNQVVLFLARLQSGPKVPAHVASKLDDTYSFGSHKNTEIRCGFYGLALHDVNGKYAQAAAEWVSRQGRMKYCRPLYRALNKVDPELAKRTFRANRSFYHPIAAAMIAIVSTHFSCFLLEWKSFSISKNQLGTVYGQLTVFVGHVSDKCSLFPGFGYLIDVSYVRFSLVSYLLAILRNLIDILNYCLFRCYPGFTITR